MSNPNPILPPDPDLPLIHTRNYEVRAFKMSDSEIMLRGAVRDDKAPGLYVDGDPEPLTIHHMVVELRVSYPTFEILDATTELKEFPHHECPGIAPHYRKLVGLSIARGFTHKVRELFGGPRGCTHTTALLQAMGPVAIQCGWSMRVMAMKEAADSGHPSSHPRRANELSPPTSTPATSGTRTAIRFASSALVEPSAHRCR
ncbi:MAG: DUF2889 domain-containing protein [Acidimicrobiia bacterium]|nr:DUF2889 domain-containing protein [Acidimicrobiia bacterium]